MKLKRKFGFWAVFCIASGAMISSGLFVLPGLAFAEAGPAVILAYALAGLMVIPAVAAKAELATAMPRSGGSYFFIERSMGALPGTLAGFANWLSIVLKAAFALIGIGAFARLVWPEAQLTEAQWVWIIKAIAITACVLFCLLNILSVKMTGTVQILLVVALLAVLGLFVGAGIGRVKHANLENFMYKGWQQVLYTAALVFVSYAGLTKVASIAGEIRHPGRNIPAGMFLATLVVSLLYVAAVFIAVGVTEPAELKGNLTPLSLAAGEFLGRGGVVLLAVAAMFAFITTANSGILSASRSPMAMSRDGLLPKFLQNVHTKFHTPVASVIITSGFMIGLIAILSITDLVKAASTMMLMLFTLVNVAVIIMRTSKLQNYRPLYKAPLYPWLQIIGIAIYLILIVNMGAAALITTGAFMLAGVVWYVAYVRARTARESAFIYMVKNIVAKEIYRSELEEELKTIAFERDEVQQDRFDRLINNCVILDLAGSQGASHVFRQVANMLSSRIGMDEEKIYRLLEAREAQSSTVIQPGLAIPHIIVDGEGLFDVLMFRAKDGIDFPDQPEPVSAGFVLIGSRDQRNYHLKALMAIAHIVQESDFMQRWLEAPKAEHLRDMVLLSTRTREQPAEDDRDE